MDGTQLDPEENVNPDCVASVEDRVQNDGLFSVCVRCSQLEQRNIQNIRELGSKNRLRLHYSSSSGDKWSRPSPLCTLRCRRKFDTTEKWRPHPSTSQANAV